MSDDNSSHEMLGGTFRVREQVTHFVAVGATYIDTILSVPYFPSEDAKLRATSLNRRRGGNCPNLLETLQQLVHYRHRGHGHGQSQPNTHFSAHSISDKIPTLHLISTLPSRDSEATYFTTSSFNSDPDIKNYVDTSNCIYREESNEAASSYIISSAEAGTRTIVNYNELEEMTVREFEEAVERIVGLPPPSSNPESDHRDKDDESGDKRSPKNHQTWWFHFEGRNLPVTLECVRYLRRLAPNLNQTSVDINKAGNNDETNDEKDGDSSVDLTISVEIEKPGREGLQELARLADVVFYSRAWARSMKYEDGVDCLRQQAEVIIMSRPDDEKDEDAQESDVKTTTSTTSQSDEHVHTTSSSASSSSSPPPPNTTRRKRSNPPFNSKAKWLFCTWGEEGSSGTFIPPTSSLSPPSSSSLNTTNHKFPSQPMTMMIPNTVVVVKTSPAWKQKKKKNINDNSEAKEEPNDEIIDTVGAGDAWTAAMLYTFFSPSSSRRDKHRNDLDLDLDLDLDVDLKRDKEDELEKKLDFANEVAGRKVSRWGFDGLGWDVSGCEGLL